MQLFTDYNTIHDGKFLTVPLELFEVFEDKRDGTKVAALWPSAFLRHGYIHTGGGKLDIVEVLLVLSLFCAGIIKDQLTFCFQLFDDDASDSMDLVTNHVMGSCAVWWHNTCCQ